MTNLYGRSCGHILMDDSLEYVRYRLTSNLLKFTVMLEKSKLKSWGKFWYIHTGLPEKVLLWVHIRVLASAKCEIVKMISTVTNLCRLPKVVGYFSLFACSLCWVPYCYFCSGWCANSISNVIVVEFGLKDKLD